MTDVKAKLEEAAQTPAVTRIENPTAMMVASMQKLIDAQPKLVVPELEVAAFIVALHKTGGDEAVNNFTKRALGSEPFQFIAAEKQLFLKTVKSIREQTTGMTKRMFLTRIGQIGSCAGIASILGSEEVSKGVQAVMDPLTGPMRQKSHAEKREKLVDHVRKLPEDRSSVTVKEVEDFNNQLDQMIKDAVDASPQAPQRGLVQKGGAIVAIIIGLIFMERTHRDIKTDLQKIYDDGAKYIAKKASAAIEAEVAKLPAPEQVQL